jgi:hypothetical protein
MVSEVIFNRKLQSIYHYVLNNEYPYSLGCHRGTVQASMAGLERRFAGSRVRPPQEAAV